MSKTAKTVVVFGLYLAGMGISFLLAPNLLFGLLGLPPTDEVWSRVVGVLALLLSYYYIRAASSELRPFFGWTVHTRIAAFLFFTAFVAVQLAGPVLILLGLVDLGTAIWTARTIRQEGSMKPVVSDRAARTTI